MHKYVLKLYSIFDFCTAQSSFCVCAFFILQTICDASMKFTKQYCTRACKKRIDTTTTTTIKTCAYSFTITADDATHERMNVCEERLKARHSFSYIYVYVLLWQNLMWLRAGDVFFFVLYHISSSHHYIVCVCCIFAIYLYIYTHTLYLQNNMMQKYLQLCV